MATREKLALSVAEAAALLGVSKPTMYQLVKREDFKAVVRVGRRTLISRAGLESWIAEQVGGQTHE